MLHFNNAEIICVGSELLLGDIVNTNASYISSKLAEIGIPVYHQSVVGDNRERLLAEIDRAFLRADLLIFSGGLGPTCDDMTKETVCEYFGKEMHIDESSLERMEAYFAQKGIKMSQNNIKQASVPDGSIVLQNKNGTAPGIVVFNDDGKTAILLPGPPRELEPMVDAQVIPYLLRAAKNVIFSRNIHVIGMGESTVETILYDMMHDYDNPSVAPYAKDGEMRIRITAKAENEQLAKSMCDEIIEKIEKTEVGKYIYGIDVETIENAVFQYLKSKKLTLACAESCTGGYIAKLLTDVAGISEVFKGGCVTYTNEVKEKLLGVSHETLEKYGAVSEQTALEMARNVRRLLDSDIGISSTGYAGPSGGTAENPVGTVYIAISAEKYEKVTRLNLSSMRSRNYLRKVAANNAMAQILELKKAKQSI